MRPPLKVLAWICAVLAAGGIVGGAYLYGLNAGLFAEGRAEDVGRRFLEDAAFQHDLAERAVDAMLEEAPALEPARGSLVEATTEAMQTRAYREVFQGVVDVAYARALRTSFGGDVVLRTGDIAPLLDRRGSVLADLPVALPDDGEVVLVRAPYLNRLQKAHDAADRWAVPLFAGGFVLAIVALALPGRKAPRLVLLGGCIALGAAILYLGNDVAGRELAARSTAEAATVVEVLWASAATSVRTWLGAAFMGGLLLVTAGFLIGIGSKNEA